jgi:hypothetical protein
MLNPGEETVIVPVPALAGLKAERATPPEATTGDAGLNEPETLVATKLIGLVAVATGLPLISWMVAV